MITDRQILRRIALTARYEGWNRFSPYGWPFRRRPLLTVWFHDGRLFLLGFYSGRCWHPLAEEADPAARIMRVYERDLAQHFQVVAGHDHDQERIAA